MGRNSRSGTGSGAAGVVGRGGNFTRSAAATGRTLTPEDIEKLAVKPARTPEEDAVVTTATAAAPAPVVASTPARYAAPESSTFTARLLSGEANIKGVSGTATVNATPESLAGASRFFGRTMTSQDLASVVGAPDGSTVRIISRGTDLSFSVYHPDIRTFDGHITGREGNRMVYIDNMFMINEKNTLGTRMGLGIVKNAARFGITKMETSAAGSGDARAAAISAGRKATTGYDSWTSGLGGKMSIMQPYQDRLLSEYGMRAKDTNELMIKYGDAGAKAWSAIGHGGTVTWDLRPTSPQVHLMGERLNRLSRRLEDR